MMDSDQAAAAVDPLSSAVSSSSLAPVDDEIEVVEALQTPRSAASTSFKSAPASAASMTSVDPTLSGEGGSERCSARHQAAQAGRSAVVELVKALSSSDLCAR